MMKRHNLKLPGLFNKITISLIQEVLQESMKSVLPINMESPALLNAGINELVLCCIFGSGQWYGRW